MSPHTLERYIRHTAIPYPKLVERCLLKDWTKIKSEIVKEGNDTFHHVELKHVLTGHIWNTWFDNQDGTTAWLNSYSWSRK